MKFKIYYIFNLIYKITKYIFIMLLNNNIYVYYYLNNFYIIMK